MQVSYDMGKVAPELMNGKKLYQFNVFPSPDTIG